LDIAPAVTLTPGTRAARLCSMQGPGVNPPICHPRWTNACRSCMVRPRPPPQHAVLIITTPHTSHFTIMYRHPGQTYVSRRGALQSTAPKKNTNTSRSDTVRYACSPLLASQHARMAPKTNTVQITTSHIGAPCLHSAHPSAIPTHPPHRLSTRWRRGS